MSHVFRSTIALALVWFACASTTSARPQDPEKGREEVPVESQHELWIVDAATQAPLADARVHYLDLGPEQARELRELGLAGMAQRIESEGAPYASDARGLVRLPKPTGRGIALARHSELMGLWWIDEEDPRPWTLEMLPDAPWDIYVCDPKGGPIADLRLQCYDDAGDPWISVRTDAQGRARIEHAALQLASYESAYFDFVPYALMREPVSFRLEGRVPPKEPTELFLPETGIVEVVLQEAKGGPWAYESHLVWVRHAQGKRSVQSEKKQQVLELWWGWHENHRVRVERGLEVEAGWNAAGVKADVRARSAGPREQGELVRIALALVPPPAVARVRVLAESGEPLALAPLSLRVRSFHEYGSNANQVERATDERALLYVPLTDIYGQKMSTLMITVARIDRPEMQAVVTLESKAESGWVDAGDVRLALAPVLAAGRVVDPEGRPVADVEVELRGASPLSRVPHDEHAQVSENQEFSRGSDWRVRTDARGAFELRSAEPVTRVQASVRRRLSGHVPWTEGAPGRSDYELVQPAGGSASGRVLVPVGFAASDFQVNVSTGSSSSSVELAPDGTWTIADIDVGHCRVELRENDIFSWDHLVSREFEVAAGRHTQAPDIDLHELRSIRIRVVDESGAPIEAAGKLDTLSHGERSVEARAGEALALTRHARVDLRMGAPGRISAHVKDVQDGALIVLPLGNPVRVRLRDAGVALVAPYELTARLGSWDAPAAAFDAAGAAQMRATWHGKQHVYVALRDPRGETDQQVPLLVDASSGVRFELTVPESGEAVELEIDVTAEQVADARRRLEES